MELLDDEVLRKNPLPLFLARCFSLLYLSTQHLFSEFSNRKKKNLENYLLKKKIFLFHHLRSLAMGLHPVTDRHTAFPKIAVALCRVRVLSGIPSTGQPEHRRSLSSLVLWLCIHTLQMCSLLLCLDYPESCLWNILYTIFVLQFRNKFFTCNVCHTTFFFSFLPAFITLEKKTSL